MGTHLRGLAATALAVLAATAGCGGEESDGDGPAGGASETSERTPARSERPQAPPAVELPTPPPCPADSPNCETASGRIIYVERVDPDGDGDAHFVLAGSASITAPGISVVDVRTDLRPQPLPGPGDTLAASGPVFEGSYGQRQIQADRVVVGRGD